MGNMMPEAKPVAIPNRALKDASAAPPRLLGLGTAVPPLEWPQSDIAPVLAGLWSLEGAALRRWQRIIDGSQIEYRHAILPAEEIMDLSTAARMRLFEKHAPMLAHEAAAQALAGAGVPPRAITDLIVVSCTGFAAPGLDVELTGSLGLRSTIHRSMIGFMGCHGAITGLRAAIGACAAQPGAAALVVCVELCSLHLRREASIENQVASALFADGAAAAIVAGADNPLEGASAIGTLEPGRSLLLPDGRDWMSWRVTDAGFAMTLSSRVPDALRRIARSCVETAATGRPHFLAVHPGGPEILDAVEDALDLPRGGDGSLQASRAVLRRAGNMSSATVLFVLAEALHRGEKPPAMLLAFGPGLTVERLGIGTNPIQDRTPVQRQGLRCRATTATRPARS
jgi:predicted naringenin-chalcone synthase